MSTLVSNVHATNVWFDDNNIWISLEDGRQVSAPLAFYPRLFNASKKQRENFEFIGNGIGIHWEELDEDLSAEGILLGRRDMTKKNKIFQPVSSPYSVDSQKQ